MPRYNPVIHKPCEAAGCIEITLLFRVTVYGIGKSICLHCLQKAQNAPDDMTFLLTLDEKAEVSARELTREHEYEDITAEDIADTMPPKPWEA